MTRERIAQVAALGGVAAAAGLLLPWARSGTASRSSIELVASAHALDVVSPLQRVVLLVGWSSIVVLVAAALVASAWGRPALAGGLLVFLGPAFGGALVAVLWSPLEPAWGAFVAVVVGCAAAAGGLVAWRPGEAR